MISLAQKLRILIVNPDASFRELLRYLLASDGHAVEEAECKEQALRKLGEASFDVVLAGAAGLDEQAGSPFPRIEVQGESTPVLRACDEAVSPSEELQRFMFNPFDLDSIRQALEAIHHVALRASNARRMPLGFSQFGASS